MEEKVLLILVSQPEMPTIESENAKGKFLHSSSTITFLGIEISGSVQEMVMSTTFLMSGAVLSNTKILCFEVSALPHLSTAIHVRRKT